MADAEDRLGVSERQIHRYLSGETPPPKLIDEKVREIAGARSADRPEPEFRFIDLFAGIGGLRLGFEAIGPADTDDPALFVGEAEGSVAVAVPLDDGVRSDYYLPLTRYVLNRACLSQ